MATTLVRTDLLAIISDEELTGLSEQLITSGQPEPVATCIDEGLATIKLYVDPWSIKEDALKRIWRILAVCWIYNRLSRIPAKRREEQDWAIGLLEDIRDGKFKNLLIDEDALAELESRGGGGTWGSGTQQCSFVGIIDNT